MRTPFESQNILVQAGPVRLLHRVLEFISPVRVSVLVEEPGIWDRFEVPRYHADDPARPLGYYESGARLL